MKKFLVITTLILSVVGISRADYKADMEAILTSPLVNTFLAQNNLVLYGLERTIGGLCPNNTPCPMFYKVSTYRNGEHCMFYVSVTGAKVKVEVNELRDIECGRPRP